MKHSVQHHQGSLFTPTTTIVEESRTTTPPTSPTAQEPLNIEITREALAAEIIQDLVQHRRWERELTLGATDEELSKALGTCWASNQRLEIRCTLDPEPHLICTTTMGRQLVRLDAPEIATLIRTQIHIPTVPSEEERRCRLKQHLDNERTKARDEIFTAVRNILEDRSRNRDQGFTQPFVDLLFTEDCLQEENESATLETITSMLIARKWTRLKAMKTAIQLVERAAGTWRSIERYWLNRTF